MTFRSSRSVLVRRGQGAIAALLILTVAVAAAPPVPSDDACGGVAKSGSYLSAWSSLYPNSVSDNNLVAPASSCQLCHTTPGGGPFNGYGWRVRAFANSGLSKADAILAAASFDSDADPTGSSNLDEIDAGSQPGWTPGPNNTVYYANNSTLPNQLPPAGILGDLDPPASPWTDLGGGTAGVAGVPLLTMSGPLTASSMVGLDLVGGAPSSLAIIFISFSSSPAPFLGGTLHALPIGELVVFGTDGAGGIHGSAFFPGAASGQGLWFQVGIQDLSVPIFEASLSNGVVGFVP